MEEFNAQGFFQSTILINEDGSLFDLMQLKRLGIANAFGVQHIPKISAAYSLAQYSDIRDTMDFRGDLLRLGGMFILSGLSSDGQASMLFEFREQFAGDTPLISTILDVLDAEQHVQDLFKPGLKVLHLVQDAMLAKRQINNNF